MTVTASGLYVANFIDALNGTIALNLTATTHKWSLLSDTATPNFDTDKSWNATNEVTGGAAWLTGGVLFSTAGSGGTSLAPTLTISPSGTMKWDMNDISVANTTITSAMAIRAYADALATDALIVLVDFITSASTNNGTFGVQWAATGVATLDLTP